MCECVTNKAPSIYLVKQYDPTRTLSLRNSFVREINRRFSRLRGVIREALVGEDVLGLQTNVEPTTPGRKAFDFPRSSDKVSAFMEWLRGQDDIAILDGIQVGEATERAWTNKYIQSAYQRGILRARQELVKQGYSVPTIDETGGVNVAFNTPFHIDRAGLLYTRTFSDLKGITDAMDTQLSRVLSQAISEGQNPRRIATLLTKTIAGPDGDLGITDTIGRFIPAQRRAQMLARTEIIRAHHSAMIQEYRNWAVEGVKVKAEWVTAGDKRVCPDCLAMEGRIFTLAEIESKIPLHPNCRCVALPIEA